MNMIGVFQNYILNLMFLYKFLVGCVNRLKMDKLVIGDDESGNIDLFSECLLV